MQREAKVWETLWWPAHRPLQVWELTHHVDGKPVYEFLNWARGIPQTNAGDQKLVTAWSKLGFVTLNDDEDERKPTALPPNKKYVSVSHTISVD